MSIRRPSQLAGRVIASLMGVAAAVAVAITVPEVVAARQSPGSSPDAPGLAALSDHQLAELLPSQSSFPAGWTPNQTYVDPETFGYRRYHNIGAVDGYQPVECYEVAYGISTGSLSAATVEQHDPGDARIYGSDRTDIRVEIGREFDPAVFDDMRSLVSRCAHFHVRFPGSDFTVRVLEDARPADGPQRFRYSVTDSWGHNPVRVIGTDDYAYARVAGLIVSGSATAGHQHVFDRVFGDTVRRAEAVHPPR